MDFTVQSELVLRDNVSEVLLKIGRSMRTFNEFLEKAQIGLDKLSVMSGAVGGMERLATLSKEMAESQNAVARASKESAAAMQRMAEAGAAATRSQAATARNRASSHTSAADIAMGGSMVGDAGMGMIEKAFVAEAEVQQLLDNLRMNNSIDAAKTAEIRAKAEALTRAVPGTTIAENLHIILDAYTAVGDIGEALAGSEAMSRFSMVMKSLPGAHHGDGAFAAAQALEVMQRIYDPQMHQLDVATMNAQMAAMQQVALGTGGRATPEAYLAFAKQARAGGMLANDQFLYRDLPAMMIALGGSRAGTGEAATWRQFVQGRMTKNAFEDLQKLGILDQKAGWAHGRVPNMERHLAGSGVFIENPVEWMRTVGFKRFRQHGINPDDRKSMELGIGKFASTAVGLGFLSEMALGMVGINKEGGKIGNTTTDPMKVLQNDPMQKLREFQAAENELMVTLGSALMGPALEALKGLTVTLRGMTDWAKEHPTAAKDIAIIGAGLVLLADAAGKVALVVFVGAPLLTGMVGLAGAVGLFALGTPAGLALLALGTGLGLLAATLSSDTMAKALHALRHPLDAMGALPPDVGTEAFPNGVPRLGPLFGPQTPGDPGNAPNKLLQKQSYQPGGGEAQPILIHLTNVTSVDGKVVARSVTKHLVDDLSGPSRGLTGFDPTMTPQFPGALVNT